MKFKIFSITIIIASMFAISTPTQAQIPFGGPILFSYECACSGGWFMLIYDQFTHLPIPMVFQFGVSMPRANYNIYTPAVQTLGTYTPGGICLVASLGCNGFATPATVSPIGLPGIGTSALPSI